MWSPFLFLKRRGKFALFPSGQLSYIGSSLCFGSGHHGRKTNKNSRATRKDDRRVVVRMVTQVSSSTGKGYQRLARLLRNLVVSTVAVSSTCCLHSFFRRGAAYCRYNAVGECDINPGVYNWTTSVRLSKNRSTSPETPPLRCCEIPRPPSSGRMAVVTFLLFCCHRLSVEVFAAELPRHVCLRGTSRRHVSFFMLQAAVVNVGTVKARKTEERWGPTVGAEKKRENKGDLFRSRGGVAEQTRKKELERGSAAVF